MNRSEFLKLLASQLYPILRKQGFRGSGSTLRRINDPTIHVFNVQGSSSATRCYLNLGAHLTFLPPEGGLDVAIQSMKESHCVFRERIDPPPGSPFGFVYGDTPDQAADSVKFIISAWHNQGCGFFDRFAKYPESYIALIAKIQPDQMHARDSLHYARIAAKLGLIDRARVIAQTGLETTPSRASGLRLELSNLLQKLDHA